MLKLASAIRGGWPLSAPSWRRRTPRSSGAPGWWWSTVGESSRHRPARRTGGTAMPAYSERGVHGQTVTRIAQRILSGDPAELETIDVAALQDELDVSLTVVREALKV